MPEPNESDENAIRAAIADLMKQRRLGFLVFAITAVLGIVLAVVCIDKGKQRLAPLLFVPFIGIGLSALVRVFSAKCPACGKLFFNAPARALYASTCYHCKSSAARVQHPPASAAQ